MDETKMKEQTVSSASIFEGKILHLYRDEVQLPNGAQAEREVIRHHGAVCIVPLTDDGRVILERQFRYPINQVITEIPAGKTDPGEDPLAAARRELHEETGFEADSWQHLGTFYPAAAYCDERIEMYLARGLHAGEQRLDEDEFLSVFSLPLDEVVTAILRGEIPDAKTQTAVLKTKLLLARGDF